MPAVSYDRLARTLERGPLGGLFFLHGDEDFLKEEAAARLVAAHLDPATRDFNYDQLRAGEVDAERLASVLATPPMMAEWRVVVIRDAQALAASARTRGVIEALLDRPVGGLAVILLAQLPKGSTAKFWDRLRKEATAIEFAAPESGDLPGWVIERGELEGVEVEPAAARALAAAIGASLGVLAAELTKLRDYVGDRRRVTVADVAALVGEVPRQNRWDWFDMVGEARLGEARQALPVLLDAGESGVGLILGLGTHFLRLAILSAGGEKALAAALPGNLQRWLPARLGRQARRWTPAALEAALDDLLRADRLLKSASLTDLQVMDELLLRLAARTATPVRA
jgi:DNA polymerase III subunit delta